MYVLRTESRTPPPYFIAFLSNYRFLSIILIKWSVIDIDKKNYQFYAPQYPTLSEFRAVISSAIALSSMDLFQQGCQVWHICAKLAYVQINETFGGTSGICGTLFNPINCICVPTILDQRVNQSLC